MACPKCGSDAKTIEYMGVKVVLCETCGYDERDDLESTPAQRENQREKRRFSPYKSRGQ